MKFFYLLLLLLIIVTPFVVSLAILLKAIGDILKVIKGWFERKKKKPVEGRIEGETADHGQMVTIKTEGGQGQSVVVVTVVTTTDKKKSDKLGK